MTNEIPNPYLEALSAAWLFHPFIFMKLIWLWWKKIENILSKRGSFYSFDKYLLYKDFYKTRCHQNDKIHLASWKNGQVTENIHMWIEAFIGYLFHKIYTNQIKKH